MNPFTTLPLVVGAAAVALTAVYAVGYNYGGKMERVRQLEVTLKAVKQRNSIDRDLDTKSDIAICQLLGGAREDCAEVEGLGTTND